MFTLSPAYRRHFAVSKALQLLKGGSCKWIHDAFPDLAHFGWQDGYGAFTVSRSQLPELIHYVAHQREHHRTRTFQDEYRKFMESTVSSTTSATCGDDGSSVATRRRETRRTSFRALKRPATIGRPLRGHNP